MQTGHQQLDYTRKALREMFALCDADGDGKLSLIELSRVLKEMEIVSTPKERQDLFHQLDIDGDGSISFEEFALGLRMMSLKSDSDQTSPSTSTFSSSSSSTSSSSSSSTEIANLRQENQLMGEYIGAFFEKAVRKADTLSGSSEASDLLAAKSILELLHFSGIGPLEKSLGRTLMTDWTVENYKDLIMKIKSRLQHK